MKSLINIVRVISVMFSILISCGFIALAFILFIQTKNILVSLLAVVFSVVFLLLIKVVNYAFAGKASFSVLKIK